MSAILIVGEDPAEIDPADSPPGMTVQKVLDGLNGSRDRLMAAGHVARILLTKNETTVAAQVTEALAADDYDVVVVGAGLRVLPPMAAQFEVLMNVLREKAPRARLAFNSQPDDSDKAALRQL